MRTVLIADDEPNILSSLRSALEREGYQVDTADSIAEARRRLREAFDFVLLDVRFRDGEGLDLLPEIRSGAPETVVVMMSGHATIDTAVRATRLGAWDFLEKPIALERLLVLMRNATAAATLAAENRRLQRSWPHAMVGRSPAIQRLLREIELAGPSGSRVLIHGEHGTGKELVARALHASSPRRDQPFVAVNCAAIPEALLESELFGHERGAFTGATEARRGRFEEAHLGTLFLDEIGELSPAAQTKLLRVLQENELSRVGGSRPVRVDVRVIAATNRDLGAAIREQRFREDLYFRLNVIPIEVPPLRERASDIPLLVEHFAAELARETGGRRRAFEPEALERLKRYPFPGNVRELRNLIERLLIMNPGAAVTAAAVTAVLPPAEATPREEGRLADALKAFERERIEAALRLDEGNVTRAAERLGLERSHLYKKMRALGLSLPRDPR
ncbi:MAG TPA: sigma-54 dependent transcriptional regulator [Candidatus Sulfotelmatobacter sp.]|nr:sigma-54 dependent transcriptional regulator [Candidatus Sulfotelmatobacter sp.]